MARQSHRGKGRRAPRVRVGPWEDPPNGLPDIRELERSRRSLVESVGPLAGGCSLPIVKRV